MAQTADEECGICLDALTNPVALPCSHRFCSKCLDSWRSKYGSRGDEEIMGRACPLCREKIPPSREMIMQLEFLRDRTKEMEAEGDTFSEKYATLKYALAQLEQEVGDWNGEVLDDVVDEALALPQAIFDAAIDGDVQKVLDWLGSPPVDKKRVNAKCAEYMDTTLIFGAALGKHSELLSILLQFGADVDALSAMGGTALTELACYPDGFQRARLLLEWGSEVANLPRRPKDEVMCVLQKRNAMLANLLKSDLGGRRCELINLANRPDLNGKTCVVEGYFPDKDRYKIVFEASKEIALVGPGNLKRRDRTPTDCGYYITFQKGRCSRRDFASKEECQVYVAELEANHAAEQLAGLNISSSGSSKGRRGKKGKKKGRKK